MSVRIINAHAIDGLRQLPAESVHMIATSPPYYGLRSYNIPPVVWGNNPYCGGHDFDANSVCRCGAWLGELGCEPTFTLYIAHLVEWAREARRVLRSDGVLWLNLGDSYINRPRGNRPGNWDTSTIKNPYRHDEVAPPIDKSRAGLLKNKDLIQIPARVAIALQDDGWWVRARAPWIKRNCLPEAVTDRPSNALEDVFLLTKTEDYFFDHEAVKVPQNELERARRLRERDRGLSTRYKTKRDAGEHGQHPPGENGVARTVEARQNLAVLGTRNRRNTDWFLESFQGLLLDDFGLPLAFIVNPAPFKDAHFATWPLKLVEPMIKAGTSERGCCPDCGAQWERVVRRGEKNAEHARACGADSNGEYHGEAIKDYAGTGAQNASEVKARILDGMRQRATIGFYPTCKCYGVPPLYPYPPKPKKPRTAEKAPLEIWRKAVEEWTKQCSAVDDTRRAQCAGAVNLKVKPPVVLDSFGGSGTTGLMCDRLQRDCVLIEIGEQYASMSADRVQRDSSLFAEVQA